MRIVSFHIDGFGIFCDTGGEGLSPWLNIFYGQNEAGKSTCLDFFRAMLTGYPDKTGKNSARRSYDPLNGGRPGGSLVLESDSGVVHLRRAPAAFGGLSLRAESGNLLHEEDLLHLLGGVTRDVYRRIFGFSLQELEQWDKKNQDSVRNALYGASFGPGLNPPGVVLDRIEKEMGQIFRPKGSSQPLSLQLKTLTDIKQKIGHWQEEYGAYDQVATKLEETRGRIKELAARREELELERLRVERKLGLRQQWQQWRIIADKLDNMPPQVEGFPENAQSRLGSLENQKHDCERAVAAANETLHQLEKRVAELEIDAELLGELGQLRRLAERKGSYRQAMGNLPGLAEGAERTAREVDNSLAMLGSGWTIERVRQTDRSLFAREGLEKQAAELNVAKMSHQAAMDALHRANITTEQTKQAVEEARSALEDLPSVPAILNDEERDDLRSAMQRLAETRRNEPMRQRALDAAQSTFHRAMGQAQLASSGEHAEQVALLETLLKHQEEAHALAIQINQKLAASSTANDAVSRAEGELEQIKQKISRLQETEAASGGATRAMLESRAASLRSLRNLATSMTAEEERKKELDSAIAQGKTQPKFRNWVLISIGTLFLAVSAGIFAAHWFWHLNEIVLGDGWVIPLNLWASYAALVCGVMLFAGGYSANGPEQKRHKQEMDRLLARAEASSMKLAELASQSRQLCHTAGIDSLDPVELDAMEMLLEREKEQMFYEEQWSREIDGLQREESECQARLADLSRVARDADKGVQFARRRWHDFMQGLGLANVPSAESAETLFARVEAAYLAGENVAHARTELEALWEDLHLIEQRITEMPPIKACLENATEPMSLEQAVEQVLGQCREADAISERRKKLEDNLESAQAAHERANTRQGEAYKMLEEAATALAAANRGWDRQMNEFGFQHDMAPDTAREAFRFMEACLSAEEKLHSLRSELESANAELAAMEEPLKKYLEKYNIAVKMDSNGNPDWLATLDELLEAAEAQRLMAEKKEDLASSIKAQQERVATLAVSLDHAMQSLNDFLAKGGATSIDEFLKAASTRDERRNLIARKEELEAVLRQAAQGEPFQAFLASFEKDEPDSQEKRLAAIQAELAEVVKEEHEAATSAGSLSATAERLASVDVLAELRQNEAIALEASRELAERWETLALARELVIQARQIFEEERQPEIIQQASELFAAITGGRWRGLSLNLEDSSIMALPRHGDAVDPVNLSRGTQEQAYLALRLAYIREHTKANGSLPVIMDEIMVNFDPERAALTARALSEFSATNEQQILYFTCQPHMVELLQHAFVQPALFKVENGKIAAA